MKKLLLITLTMLLLNQAKAQYVTIPDPNFVTYLQANFPSAMNGNQMDTTDASIAGDTTLDFFNINISDFYGLQYFVNLKELSFDYGNFIINHLPLSLKRLYIVQSNINSTFILPNGLEHFELTYCTLNNLPSLPNSLMYLYCCYNNITSLPTLPNSLTELYCFSNNISILPNLPIGLVILNCNLNHISNLPNLPNSLIKLSCNSNQLTAIPTLPNNLTYLNCGTNHLTNIPALPNNLSEFWCGENPFINLPNLPNSIQIFECQSDSLQTLPILPTNLSHLYCGGNRLTSIPSTNASVIYCDDNKITSLSNLTNYISFFICTNNPLLTCLPPGLSDSMDYLSAVAGTSITCLPKQMYIMDGDTQLNNYPVCTPTSGCPLAYNLIGNIHNDSSANCLLDSLNNGNSLVNVKVEKWNNGVLQQQKYSFQNGKYSFKANVGDNLTLKIDTTNMPFHVVCPTSMDRQAAITNSNFIYQNQDFGIQCNGVDLGVSSIFSIFRKGFTRVAYIKAGDISKQFNLSCGNGISGTVTTTIVGSANYVSPDTLALIPSSVIGNTLTYNIPDFGAIDINTAFNIKIATASNAILGSNVCITTKVATTANDVNHSNDSLVYCGTVVNSFDPNEKIVFPKNTAASNQWLTYTLNFQNTGTDVAYNIIIKDTLNQNFDASSFTYLASSHNPQINVDGNVVTFNFSNINLALLI